MQNLNHEFSYVFQASTVNLVLYLFNEDCLQPMAMSGIPKKTFYC